MHHKFRRINKAVLGGGGYKQRVLSLSPLAYWPLDERSGSTAVNLANASGNGAYTGVDLAQSQPPFIAPLFDGANDYCNIYSAWLNTNFNRNELTFAAWAKPYDAGVWTDGVTRHVIWLATNSTQEVIQVRKNTTNNQFLLQYILGGTAKSVTLSSQSWTTWTHLAVTNSKSGDAMMAYINGAQVGTTQTSLGTSSGNNIITTQATIGASSTTPGSVWSGWLAHAALWNRALSAAEVARLAVMP